MGLRVYLNIQNGLVLFGDLESGMLSKGCLRCLR